MLLDTEPISKLLIETDLSLSTLIVFLYDYILLLIETLNDLEGIKIDENLFQSISLLLLNFLIALF